MSKFVLAIDQGTTGTTATLINQQGRAVAKVTEEFEQIFPRPGWVEHDPEKIWRSVLSVIQKCLEKASATGAQIAAIGITNQRETVLAWDRQSHQTFHNAIVWQCRRTTDDCQRLKKAGLQKIITKKTGLVIDPYFSASKIHWLLKNVPELKRKARSGQAAVGTVDSFLIWRLSQGAAHVTDVSNASRTQLLNINSGEWDSDLLKIFKVPAEILPRVTHSSGPIAVTRGVAGLPDGIPISGVAGDQQAALFGQAAFLPGQAKCTFGTGSFLLMNTGPQRVASRAGVLTTIAWRLERQKKLTYALEGGAFICGAAVQWLRDGLEFFKTSAEVEELAERVPDTGGVEFVPALTGLGAPYWDPEARGLVAGLTRGTTKAHIARATLEAMALQNVDILKAMQKDAGFKLKGLRVDGGAVANNLLMQIQADFLGQKISRPQWIETTSAGAAYLAGLGVGFWPDLKTIEKVWRAEREFSSGISASARQERLRRWHLAIKRARLAERS